MTALTLSFETIGMAADLPKLALTQPRKMVREARKCPLGRGFAQWDVSPALSEVSKSPTRCRIELGLNRDRSVGFADGRHMSLHHV